MRRLFTILACLLAALWLPATLHCGLETAGFWQHDHEVGATGAGCAESCENDICSAVEEGALKKPAVSVKVSAPLEIVCFIRVISRSPDDAPAVDSPVSPVTSDTPPELARTWQFTARTALLPGAPARLV